MLLLFSRVSLPTCGGSRTRRRCRKADILRISLGLVLLVWKVSRTQIVPILHRVPTFDAFDDFSDFVESVSYGTSKNLSSSWFEPMPGSHTFFFKSLERTFRIDVPIFCTKLYRA